MIILFIIILTFSTPFIDFLLKRSIENQISYLDLRFKNDLGEKLQNKYPEGILFGNLIYALSLIEYSEKGHVVDIKSIEDAILRTTTEQTKSHFTKDLPLKYGAFYNGWINFALKKYIGSKVFSKSKQRLRFIKLFADISNEIIETQKDSIRLLETYSQSIWPADNLACIASLRHENNDLKKLWLKKIYEQSKASDNLINHFADFPYEIRGSSQALITFFLASIDRDLAINNYKKYKPLFVKRLFGIALVKENIGDDKSEDIDSGPLLFGFGSVATIMNTKTMATLDIKGAKITWGLLNIVGIPINVFGKKYYLFKKEPIFDIFLLWSAVGLAPKC